MLGYQFEFFQLPDVPILEESFMRKSWLLCVLLGTMAWGQAPPGQAPVPAPAGPGQGAPNASGQASAPPPRRCRKTRWC